MERAAVGPLGLALTQLGGWEDAAAESYADTESSIFSEVGDSRASSHAADSEAEGAAIADSTQERPRVQRQTSPVCRTEFTEGRLTFWRRSNAIQGERAGDIGFMLGNWGNMQATKL